MEVATAIREARERAGLTQAELAARAGTSQATLSAYEHGRKRPSLDTLERLLAATGARLAIEQSAHAAAGPSSAQHAIAAKQLLDVLDLAAALPTRHAPDLQFPRLRQRAV